MRHDLSYDILWRIIYCNIYAPNILAYDAQKQHNNSTDKQHNRRQRTVSYQNLWL